jgi:chemotaxis response regulator CheB
MAEVSRSEPKPPLRVLIVEDVETMRELLRELVSGIPGCRVSSTSRNTAEARVEVHRRRPDVVLLDEVLPGESSLDFLAELRALSIPAILVTGLEDRTHPLPDGARARLAKPTWESLGEDRQRFARELLSDRN